MRALRFMLSRRFIVAACAALVTISGCGSTHAPPIHPTPASRNLLIYWGFDLIENAVLNSRVPTFNVESPAWVDTSSIVTFSVVPRNGVNVRAVHRIDFDSGTGQLRNVSEFPFPYRILSLSAMNGIIAATYRSGTGGTQSGIISLGDSTAGVDEVLLDVDWSPAGVHQVGNREYVAYACQPSTGVCGFYTLTISNSEIAGEDLILEIDLSGREALHFDIASDRNTLYFGRTTGAGTEIHEAMVDGSGSRVLTSRDGVFQCLSCYPDGGFLLIAYQSPEGGFFEKVSIEDGSGTLLDATIDRHTRANRLRVFDGVASPFQNNMFAYTAGVLGSEGEYTAAELWLFR